MPRLIALVLSLALHLGLAVVLIWGFGPSGPSAPESVEIDLEGMVGKLENLYAAPRLQAKPISAVKTGGDYGGRNATEEALFKEFAEGGGIVGSVELVEQTPKVRFGHFLFTQTYLEKSILGRYVTRTGMEVLILDGRDDERLGKFVLYVPAQKLVRTLTPINDYIYTYGHELLSEMPAEGSLTFLGDGDRIYSFIWIPGGEHAKAMYPKRVMFGTESDQ